jgi:hypothetical protein
MQKSQWRWIAVLPTIFAVYVLGLTFTFLTMDFAMSYCPPEEVFSGACGAPWYDVFEHQLLCVPAFASGFAMVLAPSLVAPNHRRFLSWLLYLGGVGVVFAAQFGEFYLESLAATIGGGIALPIAGAKWKGELA